MPLWLPRWLLLAVSLAGGCASSASDAAKVEDERASKIAPELIALHEEYALHLASSSREAFRSRNKLLQIVDGRVVIDAVAAGETSVLQADLATLGLRSSVSFGRIVSGQLPISSIPKLTTLFSLNFARAASALTQSDQPNRISPVLP